MSALLKLAIGGSTLGAFLTGGYFLYDHLNVYWQPLSKDNSSEGYDSKFASDYKDLLTGLDSSNDRWWGLIFDELKATQTITTSKFSALKTETGKTFKDLKEACKEAYGANKTDVSDSAQSTETTKFKTSEVWRFCSPARTIADIKEETYEDSKYGGSKKDKLAATKDNDEFWKYKKEKLSSETNNPESTGSKLKALNLSTITVEELKEACKAAYQSNTTDTANYPEADVLKFCAITTSSTTPSG